MEIDLLKISETQLQQFEKVIRANEVFKDIQLSKAELILLYQLAQIEKRLNKL